MLISVVMPTYNREDFLPQAIESVVAQTYSNFELIVVDDGSVDNTSDLIKSYSSKDDRIKYFYQKNQGQSIARNHGLSVAKGDYICFLDSDNAWAPDKLERSLQAFAQHPDADIVYADCITIDEHGNELHRNNMRRYSGRISGLLLKDNFISMNTTMTRKKCFDEMGGMKGTLRIAEDYELWIRFSTRYVFQHIPEYWAFYRVMGNRLSCNIQSALNANEKIIMDFLAAYPDSVSKQERRAGLLAFYVRKARHLMSLDKPATWRAIGAAMSINPFSTAVWRVAVKALVNS